MAKLPLTYTGNIQPRSGEYYQPINRLIYPYDADEELKEAVNLAISLKMPLLLEGEPGSGKSRLAHALVYEFNKFLEENKQKPSIKYHFWSVQSINKAQDSLYLYDYIGRLQAAQIQQVIQSSEQALDPDFKPPKDPVKPENWVDYQPLGLAFKDSKDRQIQSVVLIDEIDKADRDFPNDLLQAIEDKAFTVKETGEEIKADETIPPIIIITSNQEKRLPSAFLRRCLYHYIDFPSPERLQKILSLRFLKHPEDSIKKAVERFMEVRRTQEEDKGEGEKKLAQVN